MKITVRAAAKLNLLLDLTATVENGYHSIYTVMQSVGIFDTVTVENTDKDFIELSVSDKSVPADSSNTAWKAAEEFFKYTGSPVKGIKIYIDKVIPSQAGMAGGSADAAAVIAALGRMFAPNLSEYDMCEIAKNVGSDVPFCLLGGTRLCLNKGEITAPLPDLPDCDIIVAKPSQGISTKDAYSRFDEEDRIRHPDNEGFLYAASQRDLDRMCAKAANVFEQVVEVVDRVKIKAVMRNNNAKLAMMTGSGAAVFGIFGDKPSAENCFGELHGSFDTVFMTKPEKKSIYIAE